jgi:hypothetical protein
MFSPARSPLAGIGIAYTNGASIKNNLPIFRPFNSTGHSCFTSLCRMKSVASAEFFWAMKRTSSRLP